jgi:hypothetical protein
MFKIWTFLLAFWSYFFLGLAVPAPDENNNPPENQGGPGTF